MNNFTNQVYLDAIYDATTKLEQNRFTWMERLNLWALFFTREQPYIGRSINNLSNLTADEQIIFQEQLSRRCIQAAQSQGQSSGQYQAKTTTWLNLRTGPGAEHSILGVLPPESPLKIVETEGKWIHISTPRTDIDPQSTGLTSWPNDKTGFVHKDFVTLNMRLSETRVGITRRKERFLSAEPSVCKIPLSTPHRFRIPIHEHTDDSIGIHLAKLWNRIGGLVAVLANEYQIEPELALAVLAVESQGQAFGPRNRLLIRFESHLFLENLPLEKQERFHQHFRFDQERPWREHQWRPVLIQAWQNAHYDQRQEWAVFNFACTIDETAAKRSISMGAPQIMGFNHHLLGYASVHQMFDAFSASERNQLIGFFDFVANNSNGNQAAGSLAVKALQLHDYTAFAESYNGRGQATFYAELIRNRLNIIRNLRSTLTPLPNPLPDPLVALDMRYTDGFSINTSRKNTNAHKNQYILAP